MGGTWDVSCYARSRTRVRWPNGYDPRTRASRSRRRLSAHTNEPVNVASPAATTTKTIGALSVSVGGDSGLRAIPLWNHDRAGSISLEVHPQRADGRQQRIARGLHGVRSPSGNKEQRQGGRATSTASLADGVDRDS